MRDFGRLESLFFGRVDSALDLRVDKMKFYVFYFLLVLVLLPVRVYVRGFPTASPEPRNRTIHNKQLRSLESASVENVVSAEPVSGDTNLQWRVPTLKFIYGVVFIFMTGMILGYYKQYLDFKFAKRLKVWEHGREDEIKAKEEEEQRRTDQERFELAQHIYS